MCMVLCVAWMYSSRLYVCHSRKKITKICAQASFACSWLRLIVAFVIGSMHFLCSIDSRFYFLFVCWFCVVFVIETFPLCNIWIGGFSDVTVTQRDSSSPNLGWTVCCPAGRCQRYDPHSMNLGYSPSVLHERQKAKEKSLELIGLVGCTKEYCKTAVANSLHLLLQLSVNRHARIHHDYRDPMNWPDRIAYFLGALSDAHLHRQTRRPSKMAHQPPSRPTYGIENENLIKPPLGLYILSMHCILAY